MFFKYALLTIITLVIVVAVWAVWGRQWLKARDWAWSKALFAAIEPWEVSIYKKSETILWARTKMVVGLLLTALQNVDGLDVSPIMPLLSPEWAGYVQIIVNLIPLALTLVGFIDERLRRDTTQPLELVAVTDQELAASPVLAQAVATADVAKDQAVATVEAVQEGPQ